MSRTGSRNEALVLRIILRAPTHVQSITKSTALHRSTVGSIVGRLLARKEIECIGNAADAGFSDIPRHVLIYAAPGTPSLKKIVQQTGVQNVRIAGHIEQKYRGYMWWAGV